MRDGVLGKRPLRVFVVPIFSYRRDAAGTSALVGGKSGQQVDRKPECMESRNGIPKELWGWEVLRAQSNNYIMATHCPHSAISGIVVEWVLVVDPTSALRFWPVAKLIIQFFFLHKIESGVLRGGDMHVLISERYHQLIFWRLRNIRPSRTVNHAVRA